MKKELEIEENMKGHRIFWVVKRAGRSIMLLTVTAALLGLFGDGRLSKKMQSRYPGFKLEYDHLLRYKKKYHLNCFLDTDKLPDTLKIWISHDYLNQIEIDRIQPEPLRWETGKNKVYFIFPVREKTSFQRITFALNAEKTGMTEGKIGIENITYSFKQFIYP
jgi:hypothetical protein